MSTTAFFLTVWFGAVLVCALSAAVLSLYAEWERRRFERLWAERFNVVTWPPRKRISVPRRFE